MFQRYKNGFLVSKNGSSWWLFSSLAIIVFAVAWCTSGGKKFHSTCTRVVLVKFIFFQPPRIFFFFNWALWIWIGVCVCVIPQASLTRSPPVKGEGQGEGLLFTSYDRTLVVKQISSEDVADMHSILSEYHQVPSHLRDLYLTVKPV